MSRIRLGMLDPEDGSIVILRNSGIHFIEDATLQSVVVVVVVVVVVCVCVCRVFGAVAYPRILFVRGSTNSVEDREKEGLGAVAT